MTQTPVPPESPLVARKLRQGYVEAVRFEWERVLERAIPTFTVPARVAPPDPRTFVTLTESSAPRFFRLAREVADTLCFNEPFDLLHTAERANRINAQAMCRSTPFAVRLIGPIAHLLSDGAFRAMLGHEFGHGMTHRERIRGPGVLQRNLSLASEITADRFALLACQNLEDPVHLEVACATWDSPTAQGVIAPTYLAECASRVERRVVPLLHPDGTYPTVEFRLYATWLFSRSDVYCDLVGTSAHDLSLAAVDKTLMELCINASEELEDSREPSRSEPSTPPPFPPSSPPAPLDAPDLLLSLAWMASQAAARLAPKPKRPSEPTRDAGDRLDEELIRQLDRLQREAEGDTSQDVDDLERRFRELEQREVRDKGEG